MATWPTMAVEIEFTAGTWTDVTTRVWDIDAMRGKQYELGQLSSGTLKLMMDNRDGALDPQNASSTYYPNVVLNKRIRVRATWSATTKTLFTGFIERWPSTWQENGNFQQTPLEAVDIMGVMSHTQMTTVYGQYLKTLKPYRWWPLNDLDETTGSPTYHCAVTGLPTHTYTYGGQTRVGSTPSSALGDEDLSVPYFDPPRAGAPNGSTPVENFSIIRLTNGSNAELQSGTTMAFLMTFQVPANVLLYGSGIMLALNDTTSNKSLQFIAGEQLDPFLHIYMNDNAGHVLDTKTPFRIDDGFVHTLYWEINSSGTTWKYQFDNWPTQTFTGVTYSFGSNWLTLDLGALWPVNNGYHGYCYQGMVSNVAVFNTALTNAQINKAYFLSRDGLQTQTSDQRLASLMENIGKASLAATPLDTGYAVMGPAKFNTQTANQVLNNILTDEDGTIWVDGDGQVQFASRHYRDHPTAAFNIGTGSGTIYPATGVKFDYDNTYLLNDVTVNRDGGAPMRAVNQTSVDAIGQYASSISSGVLDDNQCLAQAQFLVSTYGAPQTRVEQVVVNCAGNPAAFALLVGADINTCVRVQHNPLAGRQVTGLFWIESIGYKITSSSFDVVLQLSPDTSQKWFKLGDATYGVLGATAADLIGF